ncbi:elicitor-responsive protein 1-like [Bidens hawaiensis]|uniref:elicitor-responsive protein 1-like n=1 Tax=Bidens hawaiensis TaxID=980011 RepID=UPI00404A2928
MATPHGIHGNLLEVTVVSCNKLKDTEWISRQDPYVCVEYGSNKSRTRTCTDGGKNPTFQEKFVYTLVEGLRELIVNVWNSNTLKHDSFIGSGKVQLAKALSQGFDDSLWPLQSKTGRHAGEVRLIIHYTNAHKPANSHGASAQPHGTPQTSLYAPPPPQPSVSYPPPVTAASYPQAGGYPAPSPYPSYPPNTGGYPQAPYPPQAAPYGQPYPPNSAYPPQPYGSPYPPSGHPYPGQNPPPPY